MRLKSKFLLAVLIIFTLGPGCVVRAAASSSDDANRVLRKLDETAKHFHSTTADFQFDSVQTDPIPETDVQKGTVYYQRDAKGFKMAAHISQVNGKAAPKVYVYSGGAVRLYEPLIDQVTTLNKAGQYEQWFMLGFGASGKELEEKWEIKYLGAETLDGVKTEILEMVPKDLGIRKNLPKVKLWIDLEKGISLKQILYFGAGEYKVCVYFNTRMNQPLPADAFTFKTGSHTQFVNR
jgi:outer membrane lipoprotein-sorting protein